MLGPGEVSARFRPLGLRREKASWSVKQFTLMAAWLWFNLQSSRRALGGTSPKRGRFPSYLDTDAGWTVREDRKMACNCFIVPHDVLIRFASDPGLPNALRQSLNHSAQISGHFRALREQHNALTQAAISLPLPRPPLPRRHV